ncbi:MAG: TonB-dependent receptor [Myxococcota bacterium]|nr:TonB-dependent receptor [Myxococcota bacterium]
MRGLVLGVLFVSLGAQAAGLADAPDGGEVIASVPPRPVLLPSDGGTTAAWELMASEVMDAAEIGRRPVATTAQLLDESTGVFLQRPHSAGAAVNLRGFSGVDVATRLNGVRLNTGSANARTALTALDPFWVQRITVRRGLAPVLYGSDALGGVVEVETARPQFAPPGTLGRTLHTALISGTAALGARGHVQAGVSLERTAALVGVTGFSVSDLAGGARVGAQPYTANEGYGLGVALRHQLGDRVGLELRYLGSREGVALPSYSEPGDVRRLVGQERHLLHGRAELSAVGPFSAALDLILHRQRADGLRLQLADDLRSNDSTGELALGARLELQALPSVPWLGALRLRTGLEASGELLSSRFSQAPLSTGGPLVHDPAQDRYGAHASGLDTAVFVHATTASAGPWKLGGGVRAAYRKLDLAEDLRLSMLFPSAAVQPATTLHSLGLSAELGVERELLPGWALVLRGAGAHRPPNLDEQLRQGSQGWGYLVPDRGVKDARAYSVELGSRAQRGPLSAELFYAYTHLDNPVRWEPTTVEGSVTRAGEPYLRRVQGGRARLHSVDGSLRLRLPLDLQMSATLAYLHGETVEELEPLSRIPPPNGLWKLSYAPAGHWFGELALRWGLQQRRLSATDLLDPAICAASRVCRPSESFTALHLRGGWRPNRQVVLTAELSNLTQATYRYLGSALDEPGFSARVALEGSL